MTASDIDNFLQRAGRAIQKAWDWCVVHPLITTACGFFALGFIVGKIT